MFITNLFLLITHSLEITKTVYKQQKIKYK
jgi:hypothetical protein